MVSSTSLKKNQLVLFLTWLDIIVWRGNTLKNHSLLVLWHHFDDVYHEFYCSRHMILSKLGLIDLATCIRSLKGYAVLTSRALRADFMDKSMFNCSQSF